MFYSRHPLHRPEAPTSLIAAHLALRDAMISAEAALRETTRQATAGTQLDSWMENREKALEVGIDDGR